MTFPILGGNGAVAGYSIDNSLRFNDNDSPRLTRTPSSASNRKTWTWSGWVKRGNLGSGQHLFASGSGSGSGGANEMQFQFGSDDKLKIGSAGVGTSQSSSVFRDVSAWYHVLLVVDTTEASASNRVKIYVNSRQLTLDSNLYSTLNQDTAVNDTVEHRIGKRVRNDNEPYDGYMAECHFIDGQALSPTDFGEFDEDSGIWKPKQFSGSYGTNGFYLDFENSGSLGADQSGNGNNFTPTNLASTDQTTDTPTNNFATLNPLTPVVTHTLSEANLKSTNSSGTHGGATATINYPTSGKWYHEVRINAEDSSKGQGVAIGNQVYRSATDWGNYTNLVGYMSDGTKYIDTGYASYGTAHNAGNIIGVAYNADDQELTFYHNNSSQGTITTSEMDGRLDFNNISPIVFGRNMGQTFNFGQDSSFAGATTRQNNADGNGYGDFYYAPPSGYLALCTQNLATELSPTIDDGSAYFQSTPYTGNGSDGYAITNSGYSDLQPDFVWIKKRNSTSQHVLTDSTRGVTKQLFSSTNQVEQTSTEFLASFDSDGFTTNNNSTGTDTGDTNIANGDTYVGWQWKASGGTTSSNTSGSITSTVQANTTAGFSIVTYTGTGTAGTIGHGLGKKPQCILLKNRSFNDSWITFHEPEGATKFMSLDTTGASSDFGAMWNDTEPTTSVFSIGSDSGGRWVNSSGDTYVAYCFAPISGYSAMGKYTGNGNADGTFVYTGFRPSWVMVKNTNAVSNWEIHDAVRGAINTIDNPLFADSNATEYSSRNVDFLSNGFKQRNTNTNTNGSGNTIIYMAFAESPFVSSSGVPVVAR